MPPSIGKAIFENFGREKLIGLFGSGLGLEVFYSFVIIICSLMIYYGTKELYELSSYKGIKYFRQAFLFFAIAYFFRSFIKFVVLYFNVNGILDLSPATFGATGLATQLLFMYFSSMAVFYLLYSVIWKKLSENKYTIYMFHGAAFIVALISILSRNSLVYLGLNFLLLGITILVVSLSYKNVNRKGHNLYFIYLLLSIFWILNIIDALLPKFFQGFQLFIYLISTGIFLLILYKVIKKTGSN